MVSDEPRKVWYSHHSQLRLCGENETTSEVSAPEIKIVAVKVLDIYLNK